MDTLDAGRSVWRHIYRLYQHHRRSLTIFAFALLMALTFARFHPVDDAYISFRYAKNLVQGNGLVWNPGERLEGYSNFLWTLLAAGGMKLGLDPLVWTTLISVPLHLFSLIAVYRIAQIVIGSPLWALVVTFAFAINPSVMGFAASGIETPLQTAILLAMAWLILRGEFAGWTARTTILLSILIGLAILNRPDGIIFSFAAAYAWRLQNRPAKPGLIALLLIPASALVAPWLVWKFIFYGRILPNAFYVKVGGLHIGYGLFYNYMFALSHLFFPFIFIIIWHSGKLKRADRYVLWLVVFAAIWALYIIAVGGDFMSFRFWIAPLPLLLIVAAFTVHRFLPRGAAQAALAALMLIGPIHARFALGKSLNGFGIEPLGDLVNHLHGDGDWVNIGKRLKELFGGSDVIIAVGAAGAIPYYSELPSVDFIGLCDPVIPKIAERFTVVPGHRIIAPLEYIVERGVNLVVEPNNFLLSDPEYEAWRRFVHWYDIHRFYLDVNKPVRGRLINEARLIVIPIRPGNRLVVWYLNPHPAVDAAINKLGLEVVRLAREGWD